MHKIDGALIVKNLTLRRSPYTPLPLSSYLVGKLELRQCSERTAECFFNRDSENTEYVSEVNRQRLTGTKR